MFPSKLGDIQAIVRKTRSRISVHYLSPEWRSLDRIAKFASTNPTTGARYANSMGRRLTFCAEMALKENLQAPFLMRLWRNGAAQSDRCLYSNTYLLYIHRVNRIRTGSNETSTSTRGCSNFWVILITIK